MNISPQKVASKIESTYEKNIFSFPLKYQFHFFLRLFRITGDKKYLMPILTYQKLRAIETIQMIKNRNQNLFLEKKSNNLFKKLPKRGEKNKKRREVFQKNKQILFYFYLVESLYQWKVFKISENEFFQKYYNEGIEYLSKIDFGKIIFEKDLFLHYSAQVVNQVYYLEYLGISTLKERLLKDFQKIFFQKEKESLYDFKNKIYGLTHLVITDSDYYQRFVSKKKNKWILNYFEKNLSRIFKETNPDIVGEVGLSFKLCRENSPAVLKKIKNYLIFSFDQKRGYIPQKDTRENNDLQKAEHRNIIALMFLKDFKKLYKGPNLIKFTF